MKVAVCDDRKESLEQVEDLLKEVSCVTEINLYSDMDFFLEEVQEGKTYDVVLMDIHWKTERTGIDFAEELTQLSPCTRVIYITAYAMDYVEDMFGRTASPAGVLIKPIKKERLKLLLDKIQEQMKQQNDVLVIKYKSIVRNIPYHDIMYLESDLHKVNVVLEEQSHQCNERLSQIAERLGDQFLVCHKSYIVNMEYVKEFRYSKILLKNDVVIPVSKTRYAEARQKFFRYVAERA